ncbi:glycoside hydrolase family 71 protein [Fistulina hepatica ATCC 64428]|uniref:Glycoside hydrolase family 71 protein n=1 Tax=Fistulina hepatica ATCC 64428 TaxID=1128425 RepID=A0A0D7A5T5_9AGAR|nr:glycoside hydrolase family 71 protein [Fistulina hepatica ATCC 64428]
MKSFMVGNTYPYTLDDWTLDIQLACKHELDGFVLNVGREPWQLERVTDCFKAVRSIPSECPEDVAHLVQYVRAFGNHPNIFRLDGRVLVSTFSGENARFGQRSLEEAWNYVKSRLEEHAPLSPKIRFVPAFFIDPARYRNMTCLDGVFHWNGGWPVHLNLSSTPHELEFPALDSDLHHILSLPRHDMTYMAAVSPWFFTWIYRSDNWLFVRRWEAILNMREHIPLVQVISWNDYGESHYIGPIHGAQPNSQAWVDGFPHEPWLHLNKYFVRAFKTGAYPAIEEDQIFMWARPHPKDANAPDSVPRPNNWQLTDDVCWVIVLAKAPARVMLTTGTFHKKNSFPHEHRKFFHVDAGLTKHWLPLTPECGMRALMIREGNVVARCDPVDFHFTATPAVYNFNAYVAMS